MLKRLNLLFESGGLALLKTAIKMSPQEGVRLFMQEVYDNWWRSEIKIIDKDVTSKTVNFKRGLEFDIHDAVKVVVFFVKLSAVGGRIVTSIKERRKFKGKFSGSETQLPFLDRYLLRSTPAYYPGHSPIYIVGRTTLIPSALEELAAQEIKELIKKYSEEAKNLSETTILDYARDIARYVVKEFLSIEGGNFRSIDWETKVVGSKITVLPTVKRLLAVKKLVRADEWGNYLGDEITKKMDKILSGNEKELNLVISKLFRISTDDALNIKPGRSQKIKLHEFFLEVFDTLIRLVVNIYDIAQNWVDEWVGEIVKLMDKVGTFDELVGQAELMIKQEQEQEKPKTNKSGGIRYFI